MTITRSDFEAALATAGCYIDRVSRTEIDNGYAYDCYDNAAGDEVGFVTHRDGEIIGYTLTPGEVE